MRMSLAENITLIRGKQTRSSFARDLEISENTLRNYEKGLSQPNFETAMRICRQYNVLPDWLLTGEGPMNRETAEQTQPNKEGQCARCETLEDELSKERDMSRELMQDNRELMKENRKLMRENGDLRVELAELKARAAPDGAKTDEDRLRVG